MDQAEKLRVLARECRPPQTLSIKNKRIITVASGKGGVGKTNFSVNVAIALSLLKKKVMILDADLGMANIDVICGISPKYNLGHVINRLKSFSDIVIDYITGIKIVPGVSGVENLTSLDNTQQEIFFEELSKYESADDTDIVIIDIGAGMGPGVINFMLASNENIIITTPEPTAMMDAYALIKTIYHKNPEAEVQIIVNMAQGQEEALQVYRSMSTITKKFLSKDVTYLGFIASDKVVSKSVRSQKPFMLMHPNSSAGKCVKNIAISMLSKRDNEEQRGGIKSFFERMSSFIWG